MNNKLAPIVLFVYNRPWHTKQTVEALQKNELANESELFIYSDEAKNEDAQKSVDDVREYIEKIDGFKKVTVIKREKNWGLANSIIDGVTQIVNEYGKIIVLEDDLVTSPYFLKFMNDALIFYKNDEIVMQISGYVYPIDKLGLFDTYFMKSISCWGWATWDRAWKYYKKDIDYYLKVFDKKMIYDLNLNNSCNFFNQVKQNKKGKIDTWAIFWDMTIYLNQGLSLSPKDSFVKNIGHDGEGMHCRTTSVYEVELIKVYQPNFPRNICESEEARKAYEFYFNGIKVSLIEKVINKIKNIAILKFF